MSSFHAHFDPLRHPTSTARAAVLLVGPLLWLAALVIWAVIAKETQLILYGLVIAGGSFLVGGAILLAARALRLREERQPAPSR
jgi:hypothetical protein